MVSSWEMGSSAGSMPCSLAPAAIEWLHALASAAVLCEPELRRVLRVDAREPREERLGLRDVLLELLELFEGAERP